MAKVSKLDARKRFELGFQMPREEMDKRRVHTVGKPKFLIDESCEKTSVTKTAPVRKIASVSRKTEKLKVAAYARVSSLHEVQEGSIEAQRDHFQSVISSNPEWTFVDIYIDHGITGTKADIRPELQRMLGDCRKHKINLILTKSISRFARNVTECLEMVRTLNALGVNLFFEENNIHTGSMESELMLSLLATFAEEESQSISSHLKAAFRWRFENGTYIPALAAYGYRRTADGVKPDAHEAEVVKEIFSLLLTGYGLDAVARILNRRELFTRSDRKWTAAQIQFIVTNPVYIGDRLYQKTFKDRHFNQKKNTGQLDQYYDEDCHECCSYVNTFAPPQKARKLGISFDSAVAHPS